jgi:hypothetical protein
MGDKVITWQKTAALRDRVRNAKWGYTARRFDRSGPFVPIRCDGTPKNGDLVLAAVTRLGHHKRLELCDGRKSRLFVGDEIVVAYGNRYAPDQFEAVVPHRKGRCDLVAAGGIAGSLTFKHDGVGAPTKIKPVAFLAHRDGRPLNLSDAALAPKARAARRPPVLAVVGSSMNAGKTTAAAHLIRGLTRAGLRVGAAKVTGTGAGGDPWFMKDAGACRVLDFVDAGHPSTYLLAPAVVKQVFLTLLAHLDDTRPDVIVVEIADGLLQAETADLVRSDLFGHHVTGVLFAAGDALSAVHGAGILDGWGVRLLGFGGKISRSPLAVREVQDVVDLPVFAKRALESPAIRNHLALWLRSAGWRDTEAAS